MRWFLVPAFVLGCNRADEPDTCTPRIERMRSEVAVAFEGHVVPPDVAPWVHHFYIELQNLSDPYARAKKLSEGVDRTIGGCYGIAHAFQEAAASPAGSRRAAMARAVPDALELCQCRGVDVPSLSFILRLSPVK